MLRICGGISELPAGLHFTGVMLNQAQRQLSYTSTSLSMNV